MARLHQIAEDLHVVESEMRAPGRVVFPLRMTVVRVGGQLVLIAPIAIDEGLAAELAALGPVAHVIAPNRFHYAYVEAARQRYPEATVWIAPGLRAKRPRLVHDEVLATDTPPWPELTVHAIEGAPKLDEWVFFHRASRTLIVTDLVFNMARARTAMSWFLFRVIGNALGGVKQSRLVKWFTRDRDAAGASMDSILALDFDRVVMAHGAIIETGGREALRQATAWMRRDRPALPSPT